ncbi:MAG TPA: hypothetical protein DIT64_12110 [Verrucomicrobiales bacterium]|nr:hypothetical protein [Verrucomicrobiales bacterium]
MFLKQGSAPPWSAGMLLKQGSAPPWSAGMFLKQGSAPPWSAGMFLKQSSAPPWSRAWKLGRRAAGAGNEAGAPAKAPLCGGGHGGGVAAFLKTRPQGAVGALVKAWDVLPLRHPIPAF